MRLGIWCAYGKGTGIYEGRIADAREGKMADEGKGMGERELFKVVRMPCMV